MHVPERGAWDLAGHAAVKEVSALRPCWDGSRQGPEEGLEQGTVVKSPSGDTDCYSLIIAGCLSSDCGKLVSHPIRR
jgi:hypothetical protein